MGQARPLFVVFSFFSNDKYSTNTIYEKSVDGVLGTRTWGGRMVGADKSTELLRHPIVFVPYKHKFYRKNWRCQRDSNSDCWNRRWAHWPLDHHHGPYVKLLRLSKGLHNQVSKLAAVQSSINPLHSSSIDFRKNMSIQNHERFIRKNDLLFKFIKSNKFSNNLESLLYWTVFTVVGSGSLKHFILSGQSFKKVLKL